MNIYVGNLPFSISKDDLQRMFSEFGEVAGIDMVIDKFTNQTKGFAFVDMPDNSQADAAIKGLNKRLFNGNVLKVNQSEPKKKKPTRRSGY